MNTALQHSRAKLEDLEAAIPLSGMTPIVPGLEHYFAKGLYARRIFVEKNSILTTKIHLSQHITIALKGRCSVVREDGTSSEVVAPAVFVTEPGTKRAVFAHEDVEWVTVHACEADCVADAEAELVCSTFKQYEEHTKRLSWQGDA